jgi:hypothetical protein
MNIFRLHNDHVEAAKLNQDLHVTKICLEAVQMIANGYSIKQLTDAPRTQKGSVRRHSHIYHPLSKHVLSSRGAFDWALKHGLALFDEFEYRFGKKHFCEGFIKWAAANTPTLVLDEPEQEWPQCFKQHPECMVLGDVVAGYRNYYKMHKAKFVIREKVVYATWTKRKKPEFML